MTSTEIDWQEYARFAEVLAVAGHYAELVSYQHPDHDTETWPNG